VIALDAIGATVRAASDPSAIARVVLVVVVVAFAWNLGAHYTGAVMGMPFAARAIAEWPALVVIGVFTVLGATFASARVETTVGQNIIAARYVHAPDAITIILAAGLLTLLYNYWKVPTSTIQILVFCVLGVALAAGIPIAWATIGRLAIVWILAPVIALLLGFVFTRLLDLLIPPDAAKAQAEAQASAEGQAIARRSWLGRVAPGVALALAEPPQSARRVGRVALVALRLTPWLLIAAGVFASFTLGANDVSNATGAFILTHLFSLTIAGLIGGLAMAVGALTWGRRILHTVAFDVVTMDLTMASAAQGVQALVVIVAVSFGYFTSMNQALIGAMAGTGLARGRETVRCKQLVGILRGWAIGPLSGLALAFALEWISRLIFR